MDPVQTSVTGGDRLGDVLAAYLEAKDAGWAPVPQATRKVKIAGSHTPPRGAAPLGCTTTVPRTCDGVTRPPA